MSTESLITGNTPSTDAAQPAAAAPAPAPAADGAVAATQGVDAAGNPPVPGADPAAAAEKSTVPEKYEFTPPEGTELNPEVMGKFEGVAKELGLSQEAAQKVVDAVGPQMAAAQKAQLEAIRNEWTQSTRADKELGGDKLAENLTVAKNAVETFGTPELRALLNDTGLGNHPEIIRAFYRVGQKISGSNVIPGAAGTAPASVAATLYPNQAKG